MLPSVKISVLFCPFHNTIKCSMITTASVVVLGVSVSVEVVIVLGVSAEVVVVLGVSAEVVVVLGASVEVVKTWLSVVNEPLRVFQE